MPTKTDHIIHTLELAKRRKQLTEQINVVTFNTGVTGIVWVEFTKEYTGGSQ